MTDVTTGQGQQSPKTAQGSGPADDLPKSYRDVAGRVVNCGFEVERDEPAEPGSPFRTRLLRRTSGTLTAASRLPEFVLQRRLTHPTTERDWAQVDTLDNEIRAGLQLVRAFGEDSYPSELSRIIGYDNEAEEPFVLLTPYPGVPAASVAGRLKLEEERSFETGLFRVLRLLEVADLVHGRIGPATVWYDKSTSAVQLTDFSHATPVGDPRRRAGQRPWSVPEQVIGVGLADRSDDVWSAGQLIFHVATGRPTDPGGAPPNLSVRGAAFETLLAGVFGPAQARPSGAELLGRLKQPDPWPWPANTGSPDFARGQQVFDEQLAAKFSRAHTAAPPPPANTGKSRHTPPKSNSGFRKFFGASFIVLIRLCLAAAIAAWMTS